MDAAEDFLHVSLRSHDHHDNTTEKQSLNKMCFELPLYKKEQGLNIIIEDQSIEESFRNKSNQMDTNLNSNKNK